MFDIFFIYGMWIFWTIFCGVAIYYFPLPYSLFVVMGASGFVALARYLQVVYGRVGQLGMYYFFCHILPALIAFVISTFIFVIISVYHASFLWATKIR
jgi:hypothetical protein